MSVKAYKKNIIANYISQFYVSVIGIIILPLYIKFLGAEAYGLIGFFTLIQSWMQILDMGMTPTLSREVSHLRSNQAAETQLLDVIRSFESIFTIVSVFIVVVVFSLSDWITLSWLNFEYLNDSTVRICICLMGLTIGSRWILTLHRSAISAYELHVWLGWHDIIFATLRAPVSLIIVYFFKDNIIVFFSYQLFIGIIQQIVITRKLYSKLPSTGYKPPLFSIVELKRVAPFSIGIGYTAAIWVFTTQLDKLLLSNYLALSEYGYFTLVALISSSIAIVSSPISKVTLPRMTNLLSLGEQEEMVAIYRKSSNLVVSIVVPFTLFFVFYPKIIIYTWTGDAVATEWISELLPLFIIGNAILSIVSFQYYLQFAYGRVKLHVRYTTVYLFLLGPSIYYAVYNYGAEGAGVVWLLSQLVTFLFWMPYIHYKFVPGMHFRWLFKDIIIPIVISILSFIPIVFLVEDEISSDGLKDLIVISFFLLFSLFIAVGSSFFASKFIK